MNTRRYRNDVEIEPQPFLICTSSKNLRAHEMEVSREMGEKKLFVLTERGSNG